MPQRRGRPNKNKEAEETLVPSELHVRSAVEESLMRAIQLELTEGTSQEIWNIEREKDKYLRCRCLRTIPTTKARRTRYRRALPGEQGTKMTIGNKDP